MALLPLPVSLERVFHECETDDGVTQPTAGVRTDRVDGRTASGMPELLKEISQLGFFLAFTISRPSHG